MVMECMASIEAVGHIIIKALVMQDDLYSTLKFVSHFFEIF